MRQRWVSTGLAVLLAVAAAVLPNDSLAQGCSPRPNVRLGVSRVSDGRLTVVVSAGAGAILSVQFPGSTANVPGAPNYVIMTEGQARALPFTLVPSSPTAAQVSFDIVRTGGSSVTVPLVVEDACGPWRTFVGGGGPFLDPPPPPRIAWTPASLTLDVTRGATRVIPVTLSPSVSLGRGDIVVSPELQPYVTVATSLLAGVDAGRPVGTLLAVSAPLQAQAGVVRGTVSVRDAGQILLGDLTIVLTIGQASAATVAEGFPSTTSDRIVDTFGAAAFERDGVIMGVKAGTSFAAVDGLAASVGAVIVGRNSSLRHYELRLGPNSPSLEQAISQLAAAPSVRFASKSFLSSTAATRTPADPMFQDAWDEAIPGRDNWGHELVRLPSAWSLTTGSRAVRVGVVDAAFLPMHEDLVGNVAISASSGGPGLRAENTAHGTEVASIIGASANNGKGYAGVAWDVTMILRTDEDLMTGAKRQKDAIGWVAELADLGVRVVNHSAEVRTRSIGEVNEAASGWRDLLRSWRERKTETLLVAVAGNHAKDGDNEVDAAFSAPATLGSESEFGGQIIVVGGVARCFGASCDQPQRVNNYGRSVTIAAPAEGIVAATSACSYLTSFTTPCLTNEYQSSFDATRGTSVAAPFVSGVAALILARAEALGMPPPTAERLRAILLDGAIAGNRWICRFLTPTTETCGPKQGIPVLNAHESVKALERINRWGVGSVGPGGTPAVAGPPIPPVNYVTGAGSPRLSADGRFLAFETHSLNLVSATADRTDIGSSVLVKDRQTGDLEWVSDPSHAARPTLPSSIRTRTSAAVQPLNGAKVYAISPSMSADGRYVAFVEYTGTSASDKTTNIVVYDRTAGTYQVFPQGSLGIGGGQLDGTSNTSPPLVISGDGSTIVFRVAPDVATGLFFGDIVSLNRATGQQMSIASSLVPNEAPSPCINPDQTLCTPEVPLREAAPVIVGRGVSFDGRRVVVGACCYHVYRIDQGVATRVDPVPPPILLPDGVAPVQPTVRVGWIDMSSDGRFVVFSQVVTPKPDLTGFTVSMLVADLAGGGFRTLTTMDDNSNVTWSGPFALSGDGRLVFHQLRARSGAPVADHPTVRQLMVVRDAFTGALIDDPNTGKKEVVTATVDGVALRCGIEDTQVRLVTNSDGRILAYTDRDYEDTYQVVPWDRNQLSDVYVVDRSVSIKAPIHIEAPCTNFDLGPIIPDPH